MEFKKIVAIPAILLLVILFGCREDDYIETVGICPEVIATSPENGYLNVPIDKRITVSFNEEMNPATINLVSFTIQDEGLIAGTISYSGTMATFTPTNYLTPNKVYTGIVTTEVKDLMGNALQEDYEWSFETGETVAPKVILTDPFNLETNVFLNKTLVATFDVNMDPATINGSSFTLKQGSSLIAGYVTYSNKMAYFNPNQMLLSNTEYEATINLNAENIYSVALLSDYVWTFTTGNTIAPAIVCNDPERDATEVVFDKIISVCFSEKMNPSTINASSFTVKSGNSPIDGLIAYTDSFATFTPTQVLLSGGIYTVKITTGVENTTGIPLANEFEWSFTVKL
jgi:hypothetical protein